MSAVQSSLRFHHVPRCEPPYDDDGRVSGVPAVEAYAAAQGTLALRLPVAPPSAPPRHLRLVRPDASAALPPARPWACRFVQALVEVLAGARPMTQLSRWMSAETYDMIHRRLLEQAGDGAVRRARNAASGRSGGTTRGTRPVVRSVHVSTPREDVAEACALVVHHGRSRAVALRFEGRANRWLCTAVEVG